MSEPQSHSPDFMCASFIKPICSVRDPSCERPQPWDKAGVVMINLCVTYLQRLTVKAVLHFELTMSRCKCLDARLQRTYNERL